MALAFDLKPLELELDKENLHLAQNQPLQIIDPIIYAENREHRANADS